MNPLHENFKPYKLMLHCLTTITVLMVLGLSTATVQAGYGQIYKLTANDGEFGDRFGSSVAIDGTTVIVGASSDDDEDKGTGAGSAYVFNATTGNQLFKLTANDGKKNDGLGLSVGISGTTAIAGAPYSDSDGNYSGSAYLFDTTTGNRLLKLTPNDAQEDTFFGVSVAISGNIAIVGATGSNNFGGSAYLFNVNTGSQIAKLTASDGKAGDIFGFSVAIDGQTAIVGAPNNSDSQHQGGSAYLFDTTTRQQIGKLSAVDSEPGQYFGSAVDLDGTTAVVGSKDDAENGLFSGSAYLFDMTTGNQLNKLTDKAGMAQDRFGTTVGLSGVNTLVGAHWDADNGVKSGSIFHYDAFTGQQLATLSPDDARPNDLFGISVAIDGTAAVVGAFGDARRGPFTGSAYVFFIPEPGSVLLHCLGGVLLLKCGRTS